MATPTGHALKEALHKEPIQIKKKKEESLSEEIESISIFGAEQNNLKHLDLTFPRGKISVCTGPSGSGKSSLAFDTVYAEGQRRYIESLSPYARQFVRKMPKPKVTRIEGLSPSIAIEQKAAAGNPRSTVGTMTEIYDYLRILFARAGTAYSPETGEEIKSITKEYVVQQLLKLPEGEKIHILAPIDIGKNDKFEELIFKLRKSGFLRLRLNETFYELDDEIPFDRRRKNSLALVIDRLKISSSSESRLFEAIENATNQSGNKVLIVRENGEELFFNLAFAVESTGKSYPEITPHTFSFNSPEGMCLDCQGLGVQFGANFTQNIELMSLSLAGLLRHLWTEGSKELLDPILELEKIDPYLPLKELTTSQLQILLNGFPEEKWIESKRGFRYRWLGLQTVLAKAGKCAVSEVREPLIPLLDEIECISCRGSRLNPLARNVRIHEHSIASLCHISLQQVNGFLERMEISDKLRKLLDEVLKQLKGRLEFLLEVGLHYISLDRRAPTLSNGETQRIRLARQLGNQLTGVLYVLDEPSIGLHPRDNDRVNRALIKLKELGNTLLMVEHDPLTLRIADEIYDFGPGAGRHGGRLVAQGTYSQILKDPLSLTGAYLSGKKKIPIPQKRRLPKGVFPIEQAAVHNLKRFSFSLPLGALTCLTGVSGSGKSTLLHDVIFPQVKATLDQQTPFNQIITIDQDPIGHTVRSDVGTYVEVLPLIREFYASLADARVKGLLPRHFSYNHRKGMCTQCFGLGYKKIEMLFLPSVKVTCDQCQGLRLNPVSLEIVYKNKNFGQLLDSTVEEARILFEHLPKAVRILDTLISVGLGYLKLGQEMASLSGGEAQRMKLSRELSRRGTGKTLYLLDEPTTGLHPDDILKLLGVLQRLVDKGNTMVIIEHNLDIIKNADYILELGPEAGEEGGELICAGTPEEIAAHPTSYTAHYLREVL